ncbi:GATA type zinc finger [Ceratobasidium sp. AG-Ba]|nr:GATA type zinc finger [Ceratobasidium sp. AG-Ba]QRW01895.1 GATA type zinc finger [Ceratobasidium sp. AG-Ba]
MDAYSDHSSMTSSSPFQTPSPRTSMSFEERQAQIAYPDDTPAMLYTEPQSLYTAPYDEQWAPALADQYASVYAPKVPALDARPRGLQSEWSDVGPFSLPSYPPQPPAYVPQQPMYTRMGYDMPPPLAPGLDDPYDAPTPHIKAEPAVVVPTQSPYYSRPPSVASSLASAPPHHIVHVVFTDDAASKETQYLRRRCHNCQQVEPPSWRRSHLVPGKIVCNRCGLYERTHLRPRPHRFDEVRTGNKGRKPTKQPGSRQGSPQPQLTQFTVKQEFVTEADLDSRRGSVASSFSSASSPSEWEDGANYTTLRLSPPHQHAAAHDGGVQRGAAHMADPSLAARFRAGRKSATAPYEAFAAARMGPPTPPLVPGAEAVGMADVAFATPPVRRHTLGTEVADMSAWSALPADFALQNTQQPVVPSIAY